MTATGATVRLARVTEAAAIVDLMRTGRKQIPLVESFGGPQAVEWIHSRCKMGCVYIVEDDNLLAAMMMLVGDEINYIVVDPAFYRKGFASRLLDHAKSKKSYLRGKVKLTNDAMRNALIKSGFVRESVYDSPGNDGVEWQGFSWRQINR